MSTLQDEARYMAVKLAISALMTPEAVERLRRMQPPPVEMGISPEYHSAVQAEVDDWIRGFEGRPSAE